MRIKSKKPLAVAAVALLLVGIGGAAFAYWTNQGTGNGTGTTGTNQAITINQTSTVAGLAPGGAAQALSGNFNNPNTSPVRVATVSVTVTTVTKATGVTGTCDASDYTIVGSPMTVGVDIPAGSAVGSFSGATVAFNNKATVNQDACKDATLTFSYTSN